MSKPPLGKIGHSSGPWISELSGRLGLRSFSGHPQLLRRSSVTSATAALASAACGAILRQSYT